MIKLLTKVPSKIYIACSGGVDSIACVDFLNKNRQIHLLFFNHGTETSRQAESFVSQFAKRNQLLLSIGKIENEKPVKTSQEEYWRNERYSFFSRFTDNPVVTCHHLDDAVETWIMTSLKGKPAIIPPARGNYLRPFLTTRKSTLIEWVKKKNIEWCQDETNFENIHARNYVRNVMMEHVIHVSPGIHTIVKKMYLADK